MKGAGDDGVGLQFLQCAKDLCNAVWTWKFSCSHTYRELKELKLILEEEIGDPLLWFDFRHYQLLKYPRLYFLSATLPNTAFPLNTVPALLSVILFTDFLKFLDLFVRMGISFVIVDVIYCRSKLSNSQKLLDQNKVCYYLSTCQKKNSENFKFTFEL